MVRSMMNEREPRSVGAFGQGGGSPWFAVMRASAFGLVVWLGCGGAPQQQPQQAQAPSTEPAPAASPRMIITDTRVEILDPIRFAGSAAQIADDSAPTLDAVANTLKGNPSILVVEIDAYAAPRDLAQQRAEAVVAALVARGIAPGRLRAAGVLGTPGQPPKLEIVILTRAP
jgi:hypothetical protein